MYIHCDRIICTCIRVSYRGWGVWKSPVPPPPKPHFPPPEFLKFSMGIYESSKYFSGGHYPFFLTHQNILYETLVHNYFNYCVYEKSSWSSLICLQLTCMYICVFHSYVVLNHGRSFSLLQEFPDVGFDQDTRRCVSEILVCPYCMCF